MQPAEHKQETEKQGVFARSVCAAIARSGSVCSPDSHRASESRRVVGGKSVDEVTVGWDLVFGWGGMNGAREEGGVERR